MRDHMQREKKLDPDDENYNDGISDEDRPYLNTLIIMKQQNLNTVSAMLIRYMAIGIFLLYVSMSVMPFIMQLATLLKN